MCESELSPDPLRQANGGAAQGVTAKSVGIGAGQRPVEALARREVAGRQRPRESAASSQVEKLTTAARPHAAATIRDRRTASSREQLAGQLVRLRAAVNAWGGAPRTSRRGIGPPLDASHRAAMELDQVAHDREPEAEAAEWPREAAVALAEAVEHERQHVGRDADPGVGHADFGVRPSGRRRTVTCPPRGVNLMALLTRFHTTCCRRAASP